MERLNAPAGVYGRIVKGSRTIADIAASEDIKLERLA